MSGLIFVPHLDIARIERRGILTVPSEEATVACDCTRGMPRCAGLVGDNLPLEAHALGLYVYEMGKQMIAKLAARGYEWLGTPLVLHGPYVSYEFNTYLADVETAAWKDAERQDDPSKVLPYIIDRSAGSPYSDYLLIGEFLLRQVFTEVIAPDYVEATNIPKVLAVLADLSRHPKLRKYGQSLSDPVEA